MAFVSEQVEVVIVKPVAVKINTAAAMAEVSRSTIYNWSKGGLPTVGAGADQRILVEDLELFLREKRRSHA